MKPLWEASDLELLKNVYALYQEVIAPFDAVCQQKCSSCCTCNVALTSLEAALMITALSQQEKKDLLTRINDHFPAKRYQPKMTTNRFARLCMEGRDIPEEKNDSSWGKCPLLVDDMCSLYDVRPFGCRALMSEIQCRKNGYAQMPPLALTINDLFLQYIEQADVQGVFGNLSDMLILFLSENLMENSAGWVEKPQDKKLVSNEKIAVWMIPPEHRQQVRSVLEQLSILLTRQAEKKCDSLK